ncbi:DUF6055 domain-containing protein [Sphingomonas sp. 22176]|uniref:DUF6055 domain-containing protein n=1 Tax=Sphingomonas sp. 22176 TaxID=3453884 RepID=UPI003F861711
MVVAFGRDAEFSRRTVVLELPDGCRRSFQSRSFSPSDVAEIDRRVAEHPLTADSRTYATDYQSGRATEAAVEDGRLGLFNTQHFSIWYGTDHSAFSYIYQKGRGAAWDDMVRDTGAWAEQIWLLNQYFLNSPLPYLNDPSPKRINIYICGTGLPWISDGDRGDCGASASDALWLSSVYLQPGSTTLVHEYSHVISTYTGGFRDRPSAGPAWETFAEWNSVSLSMNGGAQVAAYLGQLEKGPTFSDLRYAAWPWLVALQEGDSTRPLLWQVWTDNLREADGRSREDQMEAFVRIGQKTGAFPNGWRSFADFMGMFGARLAAGDFEMQKALLDYARDVPMAQRYAELSPASVAGTYHSSYDRPLLQFGTHLIRLTPELDSSKITVQLTGEPKIPKSAWRFRLVAIDAQGRAMYSPLAAVDDAESASSQIPVSTGVTYILAVTATPYVYQTLGWNGDAQFPTPDIFPYQLKLTGAVAR